MLSQEILKVAKKIYRDGITREQMVNLLQQVVDRLNINDVEDVQELERLFHEEMPQDIVDKDNIINWLVNNYK